MTLSSEIFDFLDTLSPAAHGYELGQHAACRWAPGMRLSGKFWWR